MGGVVEFDAATGCVVLASRYGYRSRIVWPDGTWATRDPFVIVLADGREIHEGDYVEGGGGGYGFDYEGPEECAEGAESVEAFNWHEDLVIRPSGEEPVHPAPQAMVPFAPIAAPLNGLTDSIEGTVEFQVETGCALLVADGTRFAVVWPRGTRGDLDPFRLTLPGGTVVHDGDTIRGEGDVFDPAALRAFDGFPECTLESMDTQEALVRAWAFNHDEIIELVER